MRPSSRHQPIGLEQLTKCRSPLILTVRRRYQPPSRTGQYAIPKTRSRGSWRANTAPLSSKRAGGITPHLPLDILAGQTQTVEPQRHKVRKPQFDRAWQPPPPASRPARRNGPFAVLQRSRSRTYFGRDSADFLFYRVRHKKSVRAHRPNGDAFRPVLTSGSQRPCCPHPYRTRTIPPAPGVRAPSGQPASSSRQDASSPAGAVRGLSSKSPTCFPRAEGPSCRPGGSPHVARTADISASPRGRRLERLLPAAAPPRSLFAQTDDLGRVQQHL